MKTTTAIMIAILLSCKVQAEDKGMKPEDESIPPIYSDHDFQAYDCSKPIKKQPIQMPEQRDCEANEMVKNTTNMTYTLLQKVENLRVSAYVCYIKESVLTHYCGATDHQTYVTSRSYFNKARKVSLQLCRTMWNEGIFRDGNGVVHRIPHHDQGGHFYLNYNALGIDWQNHNDQAECVGVQEHVGNFRYPSTVRSVHLKITLAREEAVINKKDEVTMVHRRFLLRCAGLTGGCSSDGSTAFWFYPRSQCKFYKVRKVQGMDAKGENGTTTFISTDNSLVRVIHKAHSQQCGGGKVIATDYTNLFLTAAIDVPDFLRKLPLPEMSTVTYHNQQDKALAGAVLGLVQEEFRAVNRRDCLRRRQRHSRAFAQLAVEQKASLDGETSYLGDGVFATAAGDMWYRYRCKDLVVQATELDDCYSSLPVTLQQPDLLEFLQARVDSLAGKRQAETDSYNETITTLFIEPHTHRLTSVGIRIDCIRHFTPAYRNLKNDWVKATPHITPTASPMVMEVGDTASQFDRKVDLFLLDKNTENAGIYDAQDVREMEQRSQNQRTTTDLSHRLSSQASRDRGGDVSLHDVFHDAGILQSGWFTWIWDFFDKWGSVSAVLMGMYVFGQLVAWIFGVIFRARAIHRVFGVGMGMLQACCPTLLFQVPEKHQARSNAQPSSPAEQALLQQPIYERTTVRQVPPQAFRSDSRDGTNAGPESDGTSGRVYPQINLGHSIRQLRSNMGEPGVHLPEVSSRISRHQPMNEMPDDMCK